MNEKEKREPLSADDLQDLYGELRGSRSGPAIMDARSFLLERQMQDAHDRLLEAYETYRESRQRILRQDPEKTVDPKAVDRERQIRRLERKQEKARQIIKLFEQHLSQLEKLAGKEKAREEAKAQTVAGTDAADQQTTVPRDALSKPLLKVFHELIGDRQIEFVSDRFDFKPLESANDVVSDAVYLFRKGDRCLLVHAQRQGEKDQFDIVDLYNASNHIDLTAQQMVQLSKKRRLVLLLQR